MKPDKEEKDFFERIENFMFSRKFIFIGVLAITLPLTVNVYQLYFNISPVEGNSFKHIYAFAYAFAFGIGVLVFTFHYIRYKPVIFAIFILIVEILFFDPFDPAESYLIRLTKVFLCLFGSYTGYSYAELYAKKATESRKQKVNKAVNGHVNGHPIKAVNTEFTCEECGKGFGSVKALNGHMVAHRR